MGRKRAQGIRPNRYRKTKHMIKRYLFITFGIMIINFTYVMITVPHGIINGGVTSFSMILSRLPLTEALPVNAWVTVVTVLLALLCFLFLGRDVFTASLFSCAGGIFFFNLFSFVIGDKVIDAVYKISAVGYNPVISAGMAVELFAAAVVVGAGYYFCLSNNATAVGMDTIALIIHRKNERVPVAYAMYGINIIVLLLGLYTYGVRCTVMGIIFAGVQAMTLNVMLKIREKKERLTDGMETTAGNQ